MLQRRKSLDLQDEFREAGERDRTVTHRPFLNWEWNDRLDTAEIRLQVRSFTSAGFRGFIITPAAGLLCRPLDTEWMDALEAAVDEAQRQGQEVCLRERIHLPVRSLPDPNHQLTPGLWGHFIKADILPVGTGGALPPTGQNTIALYSARQLDGRLLNPRRLDHQTSEDDEPADVASPSGSITPIPDLIDPDPKDPSTAEGRLAVSESDGADAAVSAGATALLAGPSTETPDATLATAILSDSPAVPEEGAGDSVPDGAEDQVFLHFYTECSNKIDPLSATAIRAFIDGPPENYYREFGAEFGKTITGFVVEIPGFESPPWSQDLPAVFHEMFREDLLDALPCIFFEVEGRPEGRLRYWSAVGSLLARACTSQLQAWCSNREIRLWGLFEGGGSLMDQMTSNAGIMLQYDAAQGIILPCSGSPSDRALAIKQASSSVNQGADKRLLVELSLEGVRSDTIARTLATGVEAAAPGADDLCTVRVPYSLRGFRKSHSNSFCHPQQPSWPLQRRINQFLSRLQFLLDRGKRAASLAIIRPLRSALQEFPGSLEAADEMLKQMTDEVMEGCFDFDFLDEILVASKASVHEAHLRVGRSSYSVILAPAAITLAPPTIEVLENFLDAGGSLYRIGTPPDSANTSMPDQSPNALGRAQLRTDTRLALQEVKKGARWRVQKLHETTGPLLCREQDAGRFQFLLVANGSLDETMEVQISTATDGRLEVWDCDTGLVTPVETAISSAELSATRTIPPGGVLLLGLDTARSPWYGVLKRDRMLHSVEINGGWNLSLKDPNILVFDRCSYKIGSSDWRSSDSLLQALAVTTTSVENDQLLIRYSVDIDPTLERKNLYIALENPLRWKVVINGVPLPSGDKGASFLNTMRKYEVSRLLTAGKNIVMLSCPFPFPPEPAWPDWQVASEPPWAEHPFLIGHFQVENAIAAGPDSSDQARANRPTSSLLQDAHKLAPVRRLVKGMRLEEEGFPTFRGALNLHAKVLLPHRPGERIILRLDELAAEAVSVYINKKAAGTLLWPPYRLDITDMARAGKNLITLELLTDCPGQLPCRFGIGHVFIEYLGV